MKVDQPKVLSLSTVFESHVDIILAEEFQCSGGFIRWFWSRVRGEESPALVHSLDDVEVKLWDQTGDGEAVGETDLTVDLPITLDGHLVHIRFLIENKIAAAFQPNQPERYLARLRQAIAAGECDLGWCVLVAPAEYVDAVPGCQLFHARVTYEDLYEYFQPLESAASEELQQRRRFKQDVLRQALTKRSADWSPKDGSGTPFFRQVYELAQVVAPQLKMAYPSKKSLDAWIYFSSALQRSETFKADIYIKQDKGYAEILLGQWGTRIGRVKEVLSSVFEHGMRLETAEKSVAIRLDIRKFSTRVPFEDQRDAIAEALKVALRLQAWYEKNLLTLETLGRELVSQKYGPSQKT